MNSKEDAVFKIPYDSHGKYVIFKERKERKKEQMKSKKIQDKVKERTREIHWNAHLYSFFK